MADFGVILQTPQIRALVQQNLLQRAFHDALYPELLYRGEAEPIEWPANVGDSHIFTGVGLMKKKQRPIQPGQDPAPSNYPKEQWNATLEQWADSIDTHMPTSVVAIADLFLRDTHQLGLGAGQTMNGVARNRLYQAALSGQTVADGAQAATTTLRVKRLNGFTSARRPDLPSGSPVQFAPVSSVNKLSVTILGTGGVTTRNVVGYTPDNPNDEIGPGVLTLDVAVTVADRAYVLASDRTYLVRVGGGNSIDSISGTSLFTLAAIRTAVARFRTMNVPTQADGYYHCHLDPISEAQIFADPEWQRLNTSLPDYVHYKDFAVARTLGCIFYRNSEAPLPNTIEDGASGNYSLDDPFAGELFAGGAPTGTKVHRPLFVGQGGLKEYYQDLDQLITEAGLTGKAGQFRIVNNGIEGNVERVQLILRGPLNRLQDQVSSSYKFIGAFPFRTDATTGDASRFKRVVCVEHGE